MEKKCSKCKRIKLISEFYKNRARKGGHENYCKECSNKRKKERSNNGGNFSEKVKKEAYEKYGHKCQICGYRNNLQVDHILAQIVSNTKKSSVIENAWILCGPCNMKKGNRIIMELIRKVPKHILGGMLSKKYAEAIVKGRYEKKPFSISGKHYIEVIVKF
ncbi:HNH endonuclease [Halobacillus ihumii]|uniref:HNH endonuclease n=1 Tax=Halobacillus ihumii TaxID=2686092 RepID=UPI0013D7D92B|nr:HNH endonuclease signature motif containing protein [Halobacillus ihumii]